MPPNRVLVAHADQTERDYVAAALAGWGYNVVTAVDRSRSADPAAAAGGFTLRSSIAA